MQLMHWGLLQSGYRQVFVFNALFKFADSDQESPTLDLTNDCFRFVTGFFEVISTSAPHIYHSALLLSPKTSIVWKQYGPQARPLARFVQGMPVSWGPSIAQTRFPGGVTAAVWSPCSRFIAIASVDSGEVLVLDAATLEQLHTMHTMHPQNKGAIWSTLVFSPDGHLLTGLRSNCIVSWDLQTGGLISSINTARTSSCGSMTYSKCGTMLGVLFYESTIITYNILSGTQISLHSVNKPVNIWTHGEYLLFAVVVSGSITIWEVSFTSANAPTQISSLSTPGNFSEEKKFVFLPALSWLAFILEGRVLVWDTQHCKILLDSTDVKDPEHMSFSPDGHFFICGTYSPEYHLWKQSPDGYLPHQKLVSGTRYANPIVSPSGESIITSDDQILQLWHTSNSPTSPPSITTQHTKDFLLEFSPDESLVAVTQRLDHTVTILNVKSSKPQLVIDTSVRIYGIRITESRIIVVGDKKIITWELPAGSCILNTQGDINHVQTTTFKHPEAVDVLYASISPDLNYFAISHAGFVIENDLIIYNMHTGEELAVVAETDRALPGFTPDGNRVWCATPHGMVNQWAIVKDDRSNTIELEHLEGIEEPLSGFPWHSSCGYQATDDGWILSPNGKHLLWLPHQWRLKRERRWAGRFIALFYGGLQEVVILELEI